MWSFTSLQMFHTHTPLISHSWHAVSTALISRTSSHNSHLPPHSSHTTHLTALTSHYSSRHCSSACGRRSSQKLLAMLAHLGVTLAHFGAMLAHVGPSWGYVGPTWTLFGPEVGPCWPILSHKSGKMGKARKTVKRGGIRGSAVSAIHRAFWSSEHFMLNTRRSY